MWVARSLGLGTGTVQRISKELPQGGNSESGNCSMSFPGSGAFFSFGMSVMSALRRCTVGRSDPEALLLGSVPRMRKPSLPRKDEIIALCMLVCALIIIGLECAPGAGQFEVSDLTG